MNKLILLLVLFLTSVNCLAQDDDILPACVMINAGINLTDITQKNYVYSSKAQPGFNVAAAFRSNGDFYLLGGLQYLQINPKVIETSSGVSEQISLSYFQIPVMAGLQIVKSDDLTKCFHAQLGGSFTTVIDVADNDFGVTKDSFRKTGFTVKAGIGADLWNFIIDLHYNLLMTKVYDDPGYNNKAKLMSWELTVGYKFNLNNND